MLETAVTATRLATTIGDAVPLAGGLVKGIFGSITLILELVEKSQKIDEELRSLVITLKLLKNNLDSLTDVNPEIYLHADFETFCRTVNEYLDALSDVMHQHQGHPKGLRKRTRRMLNKMFGLHERSGIVSEYKKRLESLRLDFMLRIQFRTEHAVTKLSEAQAGHYESLTSQSEVILTEQQTARRASDAERVQLMSMVVDIHREVKSLAISAPPSYTAVSGLPSKPGYDKDNYKLYGLDEFVIEKRFKVSKVKGPEGGAEAFSARLTTSNERVVVKRFRCRDKRFKDALDIFRQTQWSPNIAKLKGYSEHGEPFMVLHSGFQSPASFASRLSALGRFQFCVFLSEQIKDALTSLHELGITQRGEVTFDMAYRQARDLSVSSPLVDDQGNLMIDLDNTSMVPFMHGTNCIIPLLPLMGVVPATNVKYLLALDTPSLEDLPEEFTRMNPAACLPHDHSIFALWGHYTGQAGGSHYTAYVRENPSRLEGGMLGILDGGTIRLVGYVPGLSSPSRLVDDFESPADFLRSSPVDDQAGMFLDCYDVCLLEDGRRRYTLRSPHLGDTFTYHRTYRDLDNVLVTSWRFFYHQCVNFCRERDLDPATVAIFSYAESSGYVKLISKPEGEQVPLYFFEVPTPDRGPVSLDWGYWSLDPDGGDSCSSVHNVVENDGAYIIQCHLEDDYVFEMHAGKTLIHYNKLSEGEARLLQEFEENVRAGDRGWVRY